MRASDTWTWPIPDGMTMLRIWKSAPSTSYSPGTRMGATSRSPEVPSMAMAADRAGRKEPDGQEQEQQQRARSSTQLNNADYYETEISVDLAVVLLLLLLLLRSLRSLPSWAGRRRAP